MSSWEVQTSKYIKCLTFSTLSTDPYVTLIVLHQFFPVEYTSAYQSTYKKTLVTEPLAVPLWQRQNTLGLRLPSGVWY